jgi:endoglycosylceramidase
MHSKSLFLLASLFGIAFSQEGGISINVKSRMLQDEYKRSILFHGVNVVYKQDPYIPDSEKFDPYLSLSDFDIDNLVNWGFNFVRLGVMWESVERSPGVFNDTYLDEVEKLINRLG